MENKKDQKLFTAKQREKKKKKATLTQAGQIVNMEIVILIKLRKKFKHKPQQFKHPLTSSQIFLYYFTHVKTFRVLSFERERNISAAVTTDH